MSATRLRGLSNVADLSRTDREAVDRVLELADNLEGLVIVRRPERPRGLDNFVGSDLKIRDLSNILLDLIKAHDDPKALDLTVLSQTAMDLLREKDPKALPTDAILPGKRGANLPVSAPTLGQLLRLAAIQQTENQERVIWDDGLNQLMVHVGRIRAVVNEGRIRVDIPVTADGLRETMQVPFAVGSPNRPSGMVMATSDRPVGNETVARIWGTALIALAHNALLSAIENLAGASGWDVRKQPLVPRAIIARNRSLTIESSAGFVFREGGK
ncbi:hypothetical protein [Profundibacter amoris]|uniref:Uncharacterized protein n=1 Tax=Profundibacter amoris TaxID=2171755 RepID=A0A347UIB6_9RHOB|nr:hypothetical protein [Profundibacter amoris]AXX98594.1 hypothetical protein BAR1_12065 [Profundibacter amoris]